MTAGEQLDRSAIAKLQKGQTQAEVRQEYGVPKRTETGANGKTLDFYQVTFFRKMPAPHRALIVRSLFVLYDETSRVEQFVHHVGELPIWRTPLGWEAGGALDEARVRSIQRETHSRDDLIATFGSPAIAGLDRNGDAMLAWYFITGNGGFFTSRHELLVTFDSSNRVKDYLLREIQQ